MYVRIWQFRPNQKRIEEFLSAYGPDGEWAALFGKAVEQEIGNYFPPSDDKRLDYR